MNYVQLNNEKNALSYGALSLITVTTSIGLKKKKVCHGVQNFVVVVFFSFLGYYLPILLAAIYQVIPSKVIFIF